MTAHEQSTERLPDDVLPALAARREEGPVVTWPDGGRWSSLMVTRSADVATMLTDSRLRVDHSDVPGAHDVFGAVLARVGVPADLDHLGRGLLTRDGADHLRLRKLVSRAFSVRRVAALRPGVEAITDALLDDLAAASAGGRPVDLMTAFAYPLPITVICELVGVPESARAAWRELGTLFVRPDPPRMAPVVREVVGGVAELLDARRAEPADDLATGLVQAHDGEDRLTTEEMTTMIVDLVVAGHETTARLIGAAVRALLTRPDQLAVLREQPDLWPDAVHELVRTCGPIPVSSPRHAAEDVEIGGTTVPAGSTVVAGLLPANTDHRAHRHPEVLDVRRRTGPGDGHLGFGRGPHYCLGAALARQEAEVALRALFTRFARLRLVDPPAGPSPLGPLTCDELLVRTQ